MFTTFARVGTSLAALVLAGTTFALAETSATPAHNVIAQASPAPTASPNPFAYRGYVRAYDFTRQNASSYNKPGTVNQQSFSAAVSLHGQYTFAGSGFTVGGTYLYSNPLNGCASASSHFTPPCGNVKAPSLNPDDTLPGFSLSTLYEAYLQYQDKGAYAKIGDQVITTPWANASDSRLKPVAFQGVDLSYKLDPKWTIEGSYYDRFEERSSSDFFNNTLLTAQYADGSGISTLYDTNVKSSAASPASLTNNGFFYGRVGYADKNLTSNLHYYAFDNIANALWFDAKYAINGKIKPFVAVQIGDEKSAGSALVGQIDSQVYGIQGGVSVSPNVVVTLGYNHIPDKTATITLPAGASCPANHVLAADKGLADYFLGNGGTPNCIPGPAVNGLNTATVYYGGWASPYTDSYATDPLFTTSISQGMADRRSFGDAGKLAATFTSDNKRFVFILSRALYSYGNNAVGVSPTQETNFDGMYYFSQVPKSGSYKGLLVRYRYAERTINYTTAYGGIPLFKYNRAQVEYDF